MPPINLKNVAVPNIPIVGALFGPLVKKFVEEATAKIVTKVLEKVDLMPFLPARLLPERNPDTMPLLSTAESPRLQQLMRRSRSVGSEPLHSESEFKADTTNAPDANASGSKKGDRHTQPYGTTPITLRGNFAHGRVNIMPQSIMGGYEHAVLNQGDSSSCSILNTLFSILLGYALAFLLFELREARSSS
ncbi:uncharacterized protein F4812DRAFT_467316 [Daldinia caldariorum]|uniref:uncharacterized protein n=1 Tax=Daldinia caldariorum TaxID=326644 RepID=UPI002008AD97|nr:uncharacterized protein F4812DRAFT_467316 [Daldinia caldariorum]KAI1471104.1 hypothetical protein F4812DRAFT_467316 [Daldinia caldariorum]